MPGVAQTPITVKTKRVTTATCHMHINIRVLPVHFCRLRSLPASSITLKVWSRDAKRSSNIRSKLSTLRLDVMNVGRQCSIRVSIR